MQKETLNAKDNIPKAAANDGNAQKETPNTKNTTFNISVLNHGFIRLVDHLGNDDAIVRAARVSYGKGTRKKHEDAGLIRYLLRNAHTSPFEQVSFTFHVKMPIFVARQWIRHRTARLNEISARYSIMTEEFYLPEGAVIAKQDKINKQLREQTSLSDLDQEKVRTQLKDHYEQAYQLYRSLLEKGIAREIARICLPVSLYTEMYWQIDLHNLFHFLHLRLHPNAQYEIRVYAEAILKIISEFCPVACQAFRDYVLDKTEFYSHEYPVLQKFLSAAAPDVCEETIHKEIAAFASASKSEKKRIRKQAPAYYARK